MNGVDGGEAKMELEREKLVYMWGYLPGALPERMPLQSPVVVKHPPSIQSWKDVFGGGCGFATAISDTGKLITWGSTDDLGHSYVTAGKHGETPEPFPLPAEDPIVQADAGWAHCVTVTDRGEVYTWGWKECVPSGKVFGDSPTGGGLEKEPLDRQSSLSTEQASPQSQVSKNASGPGSDSKGNGEEGVKRRKVSSAKQIAESSTIVEETLSAFPCLVTFNPGVRISTVAAGGRHTLALSAFRCRTSLGLGLRRRRATGFRLQNTHGFISPSCTVHRVFL